MLKTSGIDTISDFLQVSSAIYQPDLFLAEARTEQNEVEVNEPSEVVHLKVNLYDVNSVSFERFSESDRVDSLRECSLENHT